MNINKKIIKSLSNDSESTYINAYNVRVFDVSDETENSWREISDDDFDPQDDDVNYEICFTDDCGVRRALISINFNGNIINQQLGDDNLLIESGIADDS